ncbi:hypothetical protein MRX96_047734 [Rhipicephalus microplus]
MLVVAGAADPSDLGRGGKEMECWWLEDRAPQDVARMQHGMQVGGSDLVGLAAAVAEGGIGLCADVRTMARSPAVNVGLGFLVERVAAVDAELTTIEEGRMLVPTKVISVEFECPIRHASALA